MGGGSRETQPGHLTPPDPSWPRGEAGALKMPLRMCPSLPLPPWTGLSVFPSGLSPWLGSMAFWEMLPDQVPPQQGNQSKALSPGRAATWGPFSTQTSNVVPAMLGAPNPLMVGASASRRGKGGKGKVRVLGGHCMTSLQKCLVRSSAQFLIGWLLVFFLISKYKVF